MDEKKIDQWWPTFLKTKLAPGIRLVSCGDPIVVGGEPWMSYVPEAEDDESGIIVELSASGRLMRTH